MDDKIRGWCNGLMGVIIFAGSLPATKIALLDFTPQFLTVARASIAGLIALCILFITRQQWPKRDQWRSILYVCIGVVIGFPLFTALALQYINSASSMVFVGILPLMTALFAVLLTQERPNALFWLFACCGSLLILMYMYFEMDVVLNPGSLYMLIAVTLCGFGYAEGAKLSKVLGGWQVICWALLLALPVMLILSYIYFPMSLDGISLQSYLALGYVALFSMLIGFFFWYQGLALGGIAAVGQLQLLQPLIGLTLAAGLLHEHVSGLMLFTAIGVILTVGCAKRFA